MAEDNKKNFILWFAEVGIDDVPLVGGKMLLLGRCIKTL